MFSFVQIVCFAVAFGSGMLAGKSIDRKQYGLLLLAVALIAGATVVAFVSGS